MSIKKPPAKLEKRPSEIVIEQYNKFIAEKECDEYIKKRSAKKEEDPELDLMNYQPTSAFLLLFDGVKYTPAPKQRGFERFWEVFGEAEKQEAMKADVAGQMGTEQDGSEVSKTNLLTKGDDNLALPTLQSEQSQS